MKNTYSINENVQLLFFASLFYLSLITTKDLNIISFFCIINLLFVGNLRHLNTSKLNEISWIPLIRRFLFIIPLFIPFISIENLKIAIFLRIDSLEIILSIIIGLLLLLPKWKTWSMYLSDDFISLLPSKKNTDVLGLMMVYIFGAVFEELFYRLFIYQMLSDYSLLLCFFISTAFFIFHHYSTLWNSRFNWYDYLIQGIMSIISLILLIYTESIIPSIVMHLTYNGPSILMNVKYLWLKSQGKLEDMGEKIS